MPDCLLCGDFFYEDDGTAGYCSHDCRKQATNAELRLEGKIDVYDEDKDDER
jgi:hypothetical protein